MIYVGLALCVTGLGLNIFSLITSDIASAAKPVYPIIQHALMFLIPVVLGIILVSLLFSSYYSVDEKTLKTSFGIIKSKYKIEEIQSILLDRTLNKLTVHFKNSSFIVIVVKEEWYNEFIDALCKANSGIEFSINSKENDGENKENKK